MDIFIHNGIYFSLVSKPMNDLQTFSKLYDYNLYQKSFIEWDSKCDPDDDPHLIYYIIKNVDEVYWWQSSFSYICCLNFICSGVVIGLINLLVSALKLHNHHKLNKFVVWWEDMTYLNYNPHYKYSWMNILMRVICITLNKLFVLFFILKVIILII